MLCLPLLPNNQYMYKRLRKPTDKPTDKMSTTYFIEMAQLHLNSNK